MENITQQKIRGSKFTRLIFAGILGTIAFNGVMYADIAITGIPLDIPATMGSLAVGESEYAETVGHAIHFANGIGLSLLFGYVALPISKKIIKLPVIVYAIVFAIVETVIAVWLVLLPLLGAGIAGINIGPEVAVMTFARHVVFGTVMGLVLRRTSK
jgi:hypothetical protein